MSEMTPPFPDRPGLVDGLERLADRVSALTDAVNEERSVREREIAQTQGQIADVEQVDHRSRRLMLAVAVVALAGAVASFAVWTRSAVVTCENGNTTRAAITSDERLIDALELVAKPPADADPARVARYAEAMAQLRRTYRGSAPAALEPRDCSIGNALFPRQVKG